MHKKMLIDLDLSPKVVLRLEARQSDPRLFPHANGVPSCFQCLKDWTLTCSDIYKSRSPAGIDGTTVERSGLA